MTDSTFAPILTGSAHLSPGPAGGFLIHRLTPVLRAQVPDQFFRWVEVAPAGIHLRFRAVEDVTLTLMPYTPQGQTWRATLRSTGPDGVISALVVDSDLGGTVDPTAPTPAEMFQPGEPVRISIPTGEDVVELLVDHRWPLELLSLDGKVEPVEHPGRRWAHYGSSISHGYESIRPEERWVEQVASAEGLNLVDFSLAGNAQLDAAVARSIANTPAEVISLAIGINLVNADSMRERTFVPALHSFLDIIRDKHPDTPLVLATPIFCPIQENTPGPVAQSEDGKFRTVQRSVENDAGALTLTRVRELMREVAVVRNDPALRPVDGLTLLGPDDAWTLGDLLHPDQSGVDLIAARVLQAFAD